MCGDLDEEEDPRALEDALHSRFLRHAQALLTRQGRAWQEAPADLDHYVEKLFADALSRCNRDNVEAEEGRRYERLAVQPLVFARLAGFLAAHLSRSEDPLRQVIEALMLGYREAEAMDHGHDHEHDHVHDHHH